MITAGLCIIAGSLILLATGLVLRADDWRERRRHSRYERTRRLRHVHIRHPDRVYHQAPGEAIDMVGEWGVAHEAHVTPAGKLRPSDPRWPHLDPVWADDTDTFRALTAASS